MHLEETQEEFWLRLNDEAARRQTALQAIENVQAAQHTFQPTINPKSRQVRRPHAHPPPTPHCARPSAAEGPGVYRDLRRHA